MRSRLIHFAVAAAGIGWLLGPATPPARAMTDNLLEFKGTMTLNGPLGDVCADGSVPPRTPNKKCPHGPKNPNNQNILLILTTKPLTLPGIPGDQGSLPYTHGGNTRDFNFGTTICVATSLATNKPLPKHNNAHISRVNGGDCTLGATGTITGWCGRTTGLATGSFIDALGQLFLFRVHIQELGGKVIIEGHWWKGPDATPTQRGLMVWTVKVNPPTPVMTPGQNCANKTARDFDVEGVASAKAT